MIPPRQPGSKNLLPTAASGGVRAKERPQNSAPASDALFLGIGFLLFLLLTLLPNSATRVYAWPWYAVWQLFLLLGPAWLVAQFLCRRKGALLLGGTADYALIFLIITAAWAVAWSDFPYQSAGATFVFFGFVGAIYALRQWLGNGDAGAVQRRMDKVAVGIGRYFAVFALLSLLMWITQLVWPAWQRTASLNAALGEKVIPFSLTTVRNSEPLGHQNYTAGLALLMIPWFVALALTATSPRSRQWWWGMTVVGLVLSRCQMSGSGPWLQTW
jgi:hypothetical protein